LSIQIATLRAEAKVTHARYGASSHAAVRSMRANSTIVATIESHSTTISANARP
jgi:hypothetical protein